MKKTKQFVEVKPLEDKCDGEFLTEAEREGHTMTLRLRHDETYLRKQMGFIGPVIMGDRRYMLREVTTKEGTKELLVYKKLGNGLYGKHKVFVQKKLYS